MRIQAAVMEKRDDDAGGYRVEIEELELEEPRADEVLLRVTSCGVCGTDRHILHNEMPSHAFPSVSVLGHEGAGVVEAVGQACTELQPGDRVVAGFPFCGTCAHSQWSAAVLPSGRAVAVQGLPARRFHLAAAPRW